VCVCACMFVYVCMHVCVLVQVRKCECTSMCVCASMCVIVSTVLYYLRLRAKTFPYFLIQVWEVRTHVFRYVVRIVSGECTSLTQREQTNGGT
jgi:hypothetical protein